MDLVSHCADETRELGIALGSLLSGGELICLEGELGTGKTTFVQGVGEGLGTEEPIISPTFTMQREYHGPRGIMYHVDLYRVETEDELIATGLDEPFWREGVCVVEWAERAKRLLPQDNLRITLRHRSLDQREIHLEAHGPRYERLLNRLAEERKRRCS